MALQPYGTLKMNRRSFFASISGVLFSSHTVSATESALRAQEGFVVTGHLTDGGDEGTYALGQELAILAKPKSTADRQLAALLKKDVTLTVLPE